MIARSARSDLPPLLSLDHSHRNRRFAPERASRPQASSFGMIASMKRIRGLTALIHDGVELTTELIREGMNSSSRSVQRVTDQIEPLASPARTIMALRQLSTDGVLTAVQVVNRSVQAVTSAGLDLVEHIGTQRDPAPDKQSLSPLLPALTMRSDVIKTASWAGDAALGLINAAVGDHLHRQGNGLDLGMSFRVGNHYVPLTREALKQVLGTPSRKVVLFVHGLATTEWSWCLGSESYHGEPGISFGTLLERDLGYVPIWLRYNTGRHVSENGRLLATELERFLQAYPGNVEELVLIGHSMGGLVVRSACHYATQDSLRWPQLVRQVFCLGSPHRGAPLEKIGNVLTGVLGAIDLPGTLIPARLLAGRSSGIKDLRHGALLDEDWLGRDPDALRSEGTCEVPLLAHARYSFICATVTSDPDHPLGQIVGDLLVRIPSSSGPVTRSRTFSVETHRFGGVLHHQLQNHPAIYEVLHRELTEQGTG